MAAGLRRSRLVGVALLAAAALAGGLLAATSSSGRSSGGPITTAPAPALRADLIAMLRAQHLSWHAVACVVSGARFRGVRVVRCNVDFGDPHIQAYCLVLAGGRLLTSDLDPKIPCRHDGAGFATILQTSP